jgi:hypothetical protein
MSRDYAAGLTAGVQAWSLEPLGPGKISPDFFSLKLNPLLGVMVAQIPLVKYSFYSH